MDESTEAIRFDHAFLVPRGMSLSGRDAFRAWFSRRAKERLIPRASAWAKRLGVEPSSISVTDVQYQWGSCTPAGHVRLNWRLIKAPAGVADYVIVHELAHLLEASHSDRFWYVIRSQIPKVDASREWLKEHGQLLEEEV